MTLRGSDWFYIAAGAVLLYAAYRMVRFGESAAQAAGKIWDGLAFDPATLGPGVQLTPGARLSQQEFISRGYLQVLPDGRTRITPEGEAYIRSQGYELF